MLTRISQHHPRAQGVAVTTRHPTRLLLAAVVSSLLVLSACGSSTGSSSSSARSTSGTPTTVSDPLNSGPRSSIPLVSRGTGVLPSVSMAAGQQCGVAEAMPTLSSGTLTIATSEPAFEPWVVDNDPTSGNGFESAVAYAVADRLGYLPAQVTWTRVGFDEAIAKPGGFDFDINQFTITDDRRKQVDFSSGYYTVAQTVITVDGSPISTASSVADLKD